MQTRKSKNQVNTLNNDSEAQDQHTSSPAETETTLDAEDPKLVMRPEVRAAYERSRKRYAATYEYLKDR